MSPDEDRGPPPPFSEDVRNSDDDEDRGPLPAYNEIGMAVDDAFEMEQRDVIPHGRAAAGEDEDAHPAFTAEPPRLQDATPQKAGCAR